MDKVKHFFAGFIIVSVIIILLYHVVRLSMWPIVAISGLAVVTAAVWKEASDKVFNWWDLLATIAGGALPIIGFIAAFS